MVFATVSSLADADADDDAIDAAAEEGGTETEESESMMLDAPDSDDEDTNEDDEAVNVDDVDDGAVTALALFTRVKYGLPLFTAPNAGRTARTASTTTRA